MSETPVHEHHAFVRSDYGDGTYDFCLTYAHMRLLEEKADAGPMTIFKHLTDGMSLQSHLVLEIIRLALIGGGMAPVDALKTMRTYGEGRPIVESMPLALDIISATLFGNAAYEARAKAPV